MNLQVHYYINDIEYVAYKSMPIFENSGFAWMLVAVMQRPRLRQYAFHRHPHRPPPRMVYGAAGCGHISLLY